MVDYSNRWRHGYYVAQIKGADPHFLLERDFELDGVPVKAGGGWVNYDLAPGFYEVQQGDKSDRRYLAVDTLHAVDMTDTLSGYIAIAAQGPPPGQPGSWGSERCGCGADVEAFDSEGFPHCAQCGPTTEPDDTAMIADMERVAGI